MLTAIRALAEEAETQIGESLEELLSALVVRGDKAVAETQEQLEVLRRERVRRALDAVTGAVLVAFGVRLASERS